MRAKCLLTIGLLVLVCAATASAQRPLLETSDTVTVNSSPIIRNEQLSQGVLLSGTITGTGTPLDVELQLQSTGALYYATITQTAGSYKYEVVAPAVAPGDSYDVYVIFSQQNVLFLYLAAGGGLTADTKLNLALPAPILSPVTGTTSGMNILSSSQTLIFDSTTIAGFVEVQAPSVPVSGGTYSVSLPAGTYNAWVDQNFPSSSIPSSSTNVTEYLGAYAVASGPNVINPAAAAFPVVTLSGNIGFPGSGSVPANTALYVQAVVAAGSTSPVQGVLASVPASGAFSFVVPTGFAYLLSPVVDDPILGVADPAASYQPAFQTGVLSANTFVAPGFPAIPSPETPATLQGTGTTPGGVPLPYALVYVYSTQLTQAANTFYNDLVQTDAFGHYSVQLPLGTYNLYVDGAYVTSGDNDGDGKADMTVFRPSNGTFFELNTDPSVVAQQWGTNGDIPVRGDFDGDGITDIAVWRPSTGQWFIIPSSNPGSPIIQQWGASGDIPVPGDYDGDGITDFAVFRPSNGAWYIIPSSNPGSPIFQQWGTNGDNPAPADYDGDGITDFAVFRPSNGEWYIIPSSNPGTPLAQQWGASGDEPVPGDYDGDGKADIGVFRPSNGEWYIIPSSNPGTPLLRQWGTSGDIPVPADYDGDRKTDIAVWRPSNGVWYVLPSSAPGTSTVTQWGASSDVPLARPIGQ